MNDNNNMKKYAPIGLGVALLSFVITASYSFLNRQTDLKADVNFLIGIGLIIMGLAFYVMMDPESVRRTFSGRRARYGSNALVLSAAFLGILIILNVIVIQNPKSWDLTEDKVNTLTDESISVIERLEQPVQIVGFYSQEASFQIQSARDLLNKYIEASDGSITLEFVDPNENPVAAQEAGIEQDRSLVFTMGDRSEIVTFVSEIELTGALIRLISDEDGVVYFLTGHGEIDIEDIGNESYQTAISTLENKGYRVEALNLLIDTSVPEDAVTVVIARPLVPPQGYEVSLLADFLTQGGSLVILLEPHVLTRYGDAQDPLGEYLSAAWAIELQNDFVLDEQVQGYGQALAASYANHIITRKMDGIQTIFPTARSVQVGEPVDGVFTQVLIFTAEGLTWAETNIELLATTGEVNPDEGEDILGPVPIAASGENSVTGGRLVVFGDADFPSNFYYDTQRNGDMFINAVDWAAEQDELVDLTPHTAAPRFLLILPQQIELINLISVYLMPGVVVAVGVGVYRQRRRKI